MPTLPTSELEATVRTMTKRISPDSVVVIDLLSDDDDDELPTEERQKELNGLRKRFKSNNAKVKAEPTSRTKDDDEAMDVEAPDSETVTIKKRRAKRRRPRRRRRRSLLAKIKRERLGGGSDGGGEEQDEEEQEDHDDDESTTKGDEECRVVAPPAKEMNTASTLEKADGDIELVGTANETKLPHMRQHCTEFPFQAGQTANDECCDLCYCYVCDEPANNCSSWNGNHCHATDTAAYWKRKRQERALLDNRLDAAAQANPNRIQAANESAARARLLAAAAASAARAIDDDNDDDNDAIASNNGVTATTNGTARLGFNKQQVKTGPGPFGPNDTVASSDDNLTQCRKCGWFNRFFHRNFRHYANLHPVGFLDWCHHCGVVASPEDFEKVQSEPYKRQEGDVYLGEKVINFGIFAHDPRQHKQYKKNWKQSGLSYDEKEMQHDLFRHRFGERPSIKMILASVPVHEQVKPSRTSFHLQNTCFYPQSGASLAVQNENALYQRRCCPGGDKYAYWRSTHHHHNAPLVDETEGITLENEMDLVLLSELHQFDAQGLCNDPKANKVLLGYDIRAKWNKQSKSGAFTLKIFLRPNKISASANHASFAKLFGAWFGALNFALADLSGKMKATSCTTDLEHIIVVTSKLSASKLQKSIEEMQEKADKAVEDHNEAVAPFREQLTLESNSSTNNNGVLGGTCSSDLGFTNILKRFFSEILVDDIVKGKVAGKRWIDIPNNYASSHRRTNRGGNSLQDTDCFDNDCVFELNYLRKEDVPLAMVNTRGHCKEIWMGTKSLKGIVDHCENLGHTPIPFFEGLNVELLQFQKESVQWALQREQMDGGVQSMLWPKLPQVAERDTDLYFNPVLEAVRSDKPRLCRGGIIAEEMGTILFKSFDACILLAMHSLILFLSQVSARPSFLSR